MRTSLMVALRQMKEEDEVEEDEFGVEVTIEEDEVEV